MILLTAFRWTITNMFKSLESLYVNIFFTCRVLAPVPGRWPLAASAYSQEISIIIKTLDVLYVYMHFVWNERKNNQKFTFYDSADPVTCWSMGVGCAAPYCC